MKTLLITLTLSISCAPGATVFDLNNQPMTTPHLQEATDMVDAYVDDAGNYYTMKPTRIHQNDWLYGCHPIKGAGDDINALLKFNKGNKNCNLKMIGHDVQQATTHYEKWFYPESLIKSLKSKKTEGKEAQ